MNPSEVVQIINQALMAAFWLSLPLLAVGFVAGVLISLAQVLTSIHDSAFSTVPRLVIFLGAIVLLLPWMVTRSMNYTIEIFSNLSRYAR